MVRTELKYVKIVGWCIVSSRFSASFGYFASNISAFSGTEAAGGSSSCRIFTKGHDSRFPIPSSWGEKTSGCIKLFSSGLRKTLKKSVLKVWKSGKRGYFCTRNQATFLPHTEREGLKKNRKKICRKRKRVISLPSAKHRSEEGRKGRRKKDSKFFSKVLQVRKIIVLLHPLRERRKE